MVKSGPPSVSKPAKGSPEILLCGAKPSSQEPISTHKKRKISLGFDSISLGEDPLATKITERLMAGLNGNDLDLTKLCRTDLHLQA